MSSRQSPWLAVTPQVPPGFKPLTHEFENMEKQKQDTSPTMEEINLAQPPIPRLTSTSKNSRKLRVNRTPTGFYPDESSSNSNSGSPETRTTNRQSSRHANMKRGNLALLPKNLAKQAYSLS